ADTAAREGRRGRPGPLARARATARRQPRTGAAPELLRRRGGGERGASHASTRACLRPGVRWGCGAAARRWRRRRRRSTRLALLADRLRRADARRHRTALGEPFAQLAEGRP